MDYEKLLYINQELEFFFNLNSKITGAENSGCKIKFSKWDLTFLVRSNPEPNRV
jgi:hypothetical protein